ncbi:non-structural maintenance of chromosomes element 4 homolog A isoform X2 [Protopterus annectens]|uniref:non-structural maintenance of chromosomes element 4 homolog A isoform X2 n=1 Tax=Protopterus annectens TaxID=7888 RepID=UPI001CFBBCB9|nr:non-structural maintenance of chromosomes element 4 homolog A isoform X2 [Protopterus annectens]
MQPAAKGDAAGASRRRSAASHNGTVGSQRGAHLGDGGDAHMPSEDEEAEESGDNLRFNTPDDPDNRRQIRRQYRELIANMQQNREDMVSLSSNRLTEALLEADRLFSSVNQAREAALDSQFLVLASSLGKEKANQLHSSLTVFDPSAFTEDLLTFMGLNRLEGGGEADSMEEDASDGFLPDDAWCRLGKEAEKMFCRAPTFNFMLGSFKNDPPAPKPRAERQKKDPRMEEKRVMPAQLKRMEESHQEATEKEVERILGLLQSYFNQDPDTPICYYDFVINPDSFARTVENMFHVSFIIRDGFARIRLDEDKLPIIEPVSGEGSAAKDDNQVRHQAVISLSPREWKMSLEELQSFREHTAKVNLLIYSS